LSEVEASAGRRDQINRELKRAVSRPCNLTEDSGKLSNVQESRQKFPEFKTKPSCGQDSLLTPYMADTHFYASKLDMVAKLTLTINV
jgi:hypothetical protein